MFFLYSNMTPSAETLVVNSDALTTEERSALLAYFYRVLLADSTGEYLLKGWEHSAEQGLAEQVSTAQGNHVVDSNEGGGERRGALMSQIREMFEGHIISWNAHDGNQTQPRAVVTLGEEDIFEADNYHRGWLKVEDREVPYPQPRLESYLSDLEQAEFKVFEALWDASYESVISGKKAEEWAEIAQGIVQDSLLFQNLKDLEVQRPNRTVKKVWPHVMEVVENSTKPFDFQDEGGVQWMQRKAEQRFVAVAHDIANLWFADKDFLHFHAHGGAEILYTFFRHIGLTHSGATRIVRVVDLHHILEMVQIDADPNSSNRVLSATEIVHSFAQMENGWEIFGRLITFCMVDVGKRELFKGQHLVSLLELLTVMMKENDALVPLQSKVTVAENVLGAVFSFQEQIDGHAQNQIAVEAAVISLVEAMKTKSVEIITLAMESPTTSLWAISVLAEGRLLPEPTRQDSEAPDLT